MPRTAFLLSLLTLGCFKQKAVTVDFGHGTLPIHKDFRFEPREIRREPDSARFAFTRVNDTHMNGQTSYAEKIVVSHLAPDLDPQAFRRLLNAGLYDAFFTQQPCSTINKVQQATPQLIDEAIRQAKLRLLSAERAALQRGVIEGLISNEVNEILLAESAEATDRLSRNQH